MWSRSLDPGPIMLDYILISDISRVHFYMRGPALFSYTAKGDEFGNISSAISKMGYPCQKSVMNIITYTRAELIMCIF